MYTITCEKCRNTLIFDRESTFRNCVEGVSYSTSKVKEIQDRWLSSYLIYSCLSCKAQYKYTFQEVELKVRESVAKDVMNFRKIQMFKTQINPETVNPDNGLEYCGQCDGVDKEGNCYVDIIKQCTIKDEL